MDLKSLIAKMDQIEAGTYISEATAPTTFTPTHFHKGNLGNKMPLMQTPDGTFWWETTSNGGEAGVGGSQITLWNGDTLNRSGWNPASVDGVIKDGKYIDFPEGVTWKDYKQQADDDSAVLAKLKKLIELVDKYMALKAKRSGQGARPATPTTQDMGDGSKLTVDPKTGATAATNDDGTPYVPGSNPNLPKNKVKESINFEGSIAQSLVESFGYQLDELTNTMDPSNPNAAFRNMPGAGQVANDLGGGNTLGSVGRERAQRAADQALQRGRAASADALNAFKPGVTTAATTAATTAPAVTTGAKATAGAGSKMLGAGSKLLGRAAPGVGAVLGAQGAVDSYKKGDYLGAALNGLSGAFSLVPGLGWIPALGFGAWQAGRELSGATDKYDNPQQDATSTQQGGAKPTGGVDPKVQALQKKLIAAGADLGPSGADGVMGKYTQAAMQKFPNIKEGATMTQPKSVAESIRELQQRLESIENEVPVDGGAVATDGGDVMVSEEPEAIPPTPEEMALLAKAQEIGGTLGKDADGNIVILTKDGAIVSPEGELMKVQGGDLVGTGQEAPDPTGATMAEGYELEEGFWDGLLKGAAKLGRSSAVMGKRTARLNPGKTALGVGGATLAGGYATGSAGSDTPVKPPAPVKPPSQQGGANPTPTAPAGDDEEMKALRAQIEALMKELSTSKNPEVQKGLADIQAKLK